MVLLRHGHENAAYECEVAVPEIGLVVARSGSGKVRLVDADGGKPCGVAAHTTEAPNQQLGIITDFGAEVELILANNNTTVEVDGPLKAVNGGVVDKLTIRTDLVINYAADMESLVGYALEAKDPGDGANDDTKKIKARLAIQR